MRRPQRISEFNHFLDRLYPEQGPCRTVTFQVTDACNLACSYCYEINKGERRMSGSTAERMVDLLLTPDERTAEYMSLTESGGIILDFIGGEPFLEVDRIDRTIDYFIERTTILDHPWKNRFRVSISTNGILYFEPEVQRFLQKHRNHLSMTISIDGNKQLHDTCRVYPDGTGSFDAAFAAVQDWLGNGKRMSTKLTISPENVGLLYQALVDMSKVGYDALFANCVFEEGWETEHASILYWQLKQFADYLIEHDLEDKLYFSMFDENIGRPLPETKNENFCGGTGNMLCCDPDGNLYPCLRYTETSIGTEREPYVIGNVWDGIGSTTEERHRVDCLSCITRRSQSCEECFYCPIASGCGWCSAYHYQVTGTPNRRVTYSCEMMKAQVLADVYYWKQIAKKHPEEEPMPLYVPRDWALRIIPKEEYEMLLS